jgi:hypothetical protein
VIQSLIVLFIAAPMLIRTIYHLHVSTSGVNGTLAKGWNG